MKQTTRLIVQYIRDRFQSGEVVTFEELEKEFRNDFKRKKRSTLTAALFFLKRDYGMLFESVTNLGYRPIIKAVSQTVAIKRINKVKRQGDLFRTELETVDPVTLKTDREVKEYLKAWHKCGLIEDAVTIGVGMIDEKIECSQVKASKGWKSWMKTRLIEMADVS